MLTVPVFPPPGVSTSRILAPGAIACAYSTSSVVSLAQPTMLALFGLKAGTLPAGLMIRSDGGLGTPSARSKVRRSRPMVGEPYGSMTTIVAPFSGDPAGVEPAQVVRAPDLRRVIAGDPDRLLALG